MDARQKEHPPVTRSWTATPRAPLPQSSGASKPSGVGTIVLGEGNGQSRQGDANYALAENEDEARHIHALINAAGPWPLIPLGH
jgi:hypothetical protein